MPPTLALAAMLAALAFADPSDPKALDEYREVAAKAGQGADSQVGIALWCESRGLDAERARHLALAVLAAPHHVRAHALLGMVRDGSDWRRPEEVAERLRADRDRVAALADYDARRGQTPDTADAHWRLALWCEEKKLTDEARAHLTAVTRLDPSREVAWKRLGCKRYLGRWMTPEQISAEKAEADAQQKADRHWAGHLRAVKRRLGGGQTRDAAQLELAELDEPRAARAVWGVFVTRSESDQRLAADLLGQLDGTDATVALGTLAVSGAFPAVRARATQALARRDSREAVARLVDLLVTPLKYEVRPVAGPGSPGVLYVEGELFNIRRIYAAPLPRLSLRLPGPPSDLDPFALPAKGKVLLTGYVPPPQQGPPVVSPNGGMPAGGSRGGVPGGSTGGGIVRPSGGFPTGGGSMPSGNMARPSGVPNNGGYLPSAGGTLPNGGGFMPNNGITRPNNNFGPGGGLPPGGSLPGGSFAPNRGVRPDLGSSNGGNSPGVGARQGGGARNGVELDARSFGGNRPNPGPGMPSTGASSAPAMTQPAGPSAFPGAFINPAPVMTDPPFEDRTPDPERERDLERQRREASRASAIERNWREAHMAAASAEQRLAADLAAVVAYNDAAAEVNDRVLPPLHAATGRVEGPDRQTWKAWWADQSGYSYSRPERPTLVQYADVYRPTFVAIPTTSCSCFGAGTPVRTADGSRPIEELRVGDRVLTQDARTGGLGFQPVLGIFHNRPAPTLRIDLGGEVIVATPIHRFWRAGEGWALARELKSGDLVRTIGGVAQVGEVKADAVRPVFNLEVAEGHTFFVGERGALVHDNSPPRPHGRPFDATDVATTRPVSPQAGRPGRAG